MMRVDGLVDWEKGDHIVVTTTDYLPGHSEELIITGRSQNDAKKQTKVTFTNVDVTATRRLNAVRREVATTTARNTPLDREAHPGIGRLDLQHQVGRHARRGRAAVAQHPHRVGGRQPGTDFPAADRGTISAGTRSSARASRPIRCRASSSTSSARAAASGTIPSTSTWRARRRANTFVKDSSIDDSMTRWITLHATQGVAARAQCRLHVDRSRLLPRGRHRDRQQAVLQHRHLRPRGGRQRAESAQGPRHPVGGVHGSPAQLPVPLRHRQSDGVLDHERLERLPLQHGRRRREPAAPATGSCRATTASARTRASATTWRTGAFGPAS